MEMLKTLWVDYGNGITIYYKDHELLKLVLSIDKQYEKIKVTSISIMEDIKVVEGFIS